ncbi:hypothetical protein [Aquimarina litoralis]|uniref:hypothetical protein n=1 Tax=Aquimarina litoralis TaxID=584605 RepID=UPI001C582EEA|nr:hypothetical protein [Aquimarina litoralis]MBW1295066.1 hypothetical protein [Aquimarina litoralis]
MIISKNKELYVLGFSSILITLFLFFIDEGSYSFQWTEEPLVLIVFAIYAISIFLSQLLISKVFLKNSRSSKKIVLSILIGSVMGIGCTVSILLSGILQ